MRASARGPAASGWGSARQKPLGPGADAAVRVTATVVAVIAEYQQAIVRTDDGQQLAITGRSGGLPWHTLHEGQRVVCAVGGGRMPRVHHVDLPEG